MPIILWIFLVVIPLAAILMVLFGGRWADNYRAKQRAKLTAIGQELGLYSFSDGGNQTIVPLLRDLPELNLGRSQTVLYPLEGEIREIVVALFELVTFSGSSHARNAGGVFLLLRSPRFDFPAFTLQNDGRNLGRHPLQFDSHPQFSRRYRLCGQDEAALRALFSSSVLEFFTDFPHSFILRGNGNALLYSCGWMRLDRVATRDKLEAFLEQGLAIANAFAGGETERQAIVAALMAFLETGGTCQVSGGLSPIEYAHQNGTFIRIDSGGEDPREARMRGAEPTRRRKPLSREEITIALLHEPLAQFQPLLHATATAEPMPAATANRIADLLDAKHPYRREVNGYTISLTQAPLGYRYERHYPIDRYRTSQLFKYFWNRDELLQWLMERPEQEFQAFIAERS